MQPVGRDLSFWLYLDRTHHRIGKPLQILHAMSGSKGETYDKTTASLSIVYQLNLLRPNAMSGAHEDLQSADMECSLHAQLSTIASALPTS